MKPHLISLLVALTMPMNHVVAGDEFDGTFRPHVVLIISDDQMFTDFGFMGNSRVHTPHLDRLAAASVCYSHGYVPTSTCRPSLVTLLTGLYPHQHGVHFNHPPPGFAALTHNPSIDRAAYEASRATADTFVRDVPTLPRLLAEHGYQCLQTGKYWEGHWRNAGFTHGMTTGHPSGDAEGDKTLASGDVVAHGNGDHGLVIGRRTMQPIERFLDAYRDERFFIWYAPLLPHIPHDAPQTFIDMARTHAGVAEHELPYFAAIAQFDDSVGQLIRSIETRGLMETTLFVFVVDNGWQPDAKRFVPRLGEWDHTERSKRSPFDAGLRTPILFSWIGHTAPRTIDVPISSVDLLPTILQAAGIDNAALHLAGRSRYSEICDASAPVDQRPVFGAIFPGDASVLHDPSQDVTHRWVRSGRYKLIVPAPGEQRRSRIPDLNTAALFDIVADPQETHNLIGESELVEALQKVRAQLDHWWTPDPLR